MIVNSSDIMRRMTLEILRDSVTDFVECSNSHEACQLFKSLSPDLAIVDLELNGMDGLMLTRKLISLDPGARVVHLSSYDSEEFLQASRDAGALSLVLKENISEIPRTIARLGANPGSKETPQ